MEDLESIKNKLEYIDIAMKLLLQYGKNNPDVVDFLSKNTMIAKDKENGFCVVISFKKMRNNNEWIYKWKCWDNKKEDIVFLEILEPNPFFLKDEYKIYATTYTLDKGERKVLLESRKKYKEIEREFNRIKKEVENIVKKKICWKPKEQETYYYVGISGDVIEDKWDETTTDYAFFITGNCFKTKEKATKHITEILNIYGVKNNAKIRTKYPNKFWSL